MTNALGTFSWSVNPPSELQKAGLIHFPRGHIAVFDRPRLQAQACECYALVKREYDRLLPQYRQAEFTCWSA